MGYSLSQIGATWTGLGRSGTHGFLPQHVFTGRSVMRRRDASGLSTLYAPSVFMCEAFTEADRVRSANVRLSEHGATQAGASAKGGVRLRQWCGQARNRQPLSGDVVVEVGVSLRHYHTDGVVHDRVSRHARYAGYVC
jgi:hypothetical protein